MSKREKVRGGAPATVEQIVAAMAALGLYDGKNTAEEYAEEAARLDGPDAYRARMVNALLGVGQAEAAMADAVKLDDDTQRGRASSRPPGRAGRSGVKRLKFARWQVLRAAAHAVAGLHTLLDVIAASQDAVATGDVETLAAQTGQLCTGTRGASGCGWQHGGAAEYAEVRGFVGQRRLRCARAVLVVTPVPPGRLSPVRVAGFAPLWVAVSLVGRGLTNKETGRWDGMRSGPSKY